MVEDEIELSAIDAKKRLSQLIDRVSAYRRIPFLKNRHKPRPVAFQQRRRQRQEFALAVPHGIIARF
jgi:hypothetical protein